MCAWLRDALNGRACGVWRGSLLVVAGALAFVCESKQGRAEPNEQTSVPASMQTNASAGLSGAFAVARAARPRTIDCARHFLLRALTKFHFAPWAQLRFIHAASMVGRA